MLVSHCNIPKAHAEFSSQIFHWFSEAVFACAAHPMMAASVPNAPEQPPFTLHHTAHASSLPHYHVHLPTILHDNQLVCSVTATFNKCISYFFEISLQRMGGSYRVSFHRAQLSVENHEKRVLYLHVFVICSVFFCLFSFYYYLISMINFCLISIFAEMPFKLRVCVKNGCKGSWIMKTAVIAILNISRLCIN